MSHPRARFAARLADRPLLADGGMGTLLFSPRHPAARLPRRAGRDAPGPRRGDPPRVPRRRRRPHRDPHVRGQPASGSTASAWRTEAGRAQPPRRAGRPRGPRRQRPRRAGSAAASARSARRPASSATPTRPTIRAAFREQVDGLLEGGVDLLVIETFFDLGHLLLAVDEARRAADVPVIASMTFGEDLVLADGTTPGAGGRRAHGGRRRRDRRQLRRRAARLPRRARAGSAPAADGEPARSIMPNAGLPQRLEGRFVYAAEPPYFGSIVPQPARRRRADRRRLLRHDARPTSRPCARPSRRSRSPAGNADAAEASATAVAGASPAHRVRRRRSRRPPMPAERRRRATRLARALADGRFVISVEIDPPRSVRIDRTLEAARLLHAAGVDVVNVSDSAMARVRMGAMAVAFGIQHDLDLECVVHVTTRDRNLMALESELLGAHALGRAQHPRAHRRPAARRRLPDRDRRLGRRLDRPHRDPRAPQPRRGPGGLADRAAGRVHDRVRPGPDRRRRRDRVGPPGAQARRRRAPGHDPAAVRRRRRWRRCSPRRGAASARAGFPVPVLLGRAAARVAPATRSSCTTRCPGITIPDAARARDARRRGGGHGGRDRDGRRAAGGGGATRSPARTSCPASGATSRPRSWSAGSARAIPPRDAATDAVATRSSWAVRSSCADRPPRDVALPRRASGLVSRPRSLRRRPAVPAARSTDQAVYDTAGVLRAADDRAGRGRPSTASRRAPAPRSSSTPSSSPTAVDGRRGRAARDRPDGPVGRRPARASTTGSSSCSTSTSSDPCHGQVQLYAGPGFRATFLSNERAPARSSRTTCCRCCARCDIDGALLAAMDKVDAARRPTTRRARVFRQLNAVLGLLVAPLHRWCCSSAVALLALVPARHATRSTSTTRRSTCPRPPPGLTPAAGAVVRDGKVDPPGPDGGQPRPRLPRPDRVPGAQPARRSSAGRPGARRSSPGRRRPQDPVEQARLERARAPADGRRDRVPPRQRLRVPRRRRRLHRARRALLKLGTDVGDFDKRLEEHVVSQGWFRERAEQGRPAAGSGRGILALVARDRRRRHRLQPARRAASCSSASR